MLWGRTPIISVLPTLHALPTGNISDFHSFCEEGLLILFGREIHRFTRSSNLCILQTSVSVFVSFTCRNADAFWKFQNTSNPFMRHLGCIVYKILFGSNVFIRSLSSLSYNYCINHYYNPALVLLLCITDRLHCSLLVFVRKAIFLGKLYLNLLQLWFEHSGQTSTVQTNKQLHVSSGFFAEWNKLPNSSRESKKCLNFMKQVQMDLRQKWLFAYVFLSDVRS